MRQSGYLAAAGLYALENNVTRLEEDHRKAKELEELLLSFSWVEKVEPVETNIIIFNLQKSIDEKLFYRKIKTKKYSY